MEKLLPQGAKHPSSPALVCQSHNLGEQWKASWFIGVLEDRAEGQLMESRQSCSKMLSPRQNPNRLYTWRRDWSLPVAGSTGYWSCPLRVFNAATLHRDNTDGAICHSTLFGGGVWGVRQLCPAHCHTLHVSQQQGHRKSSRLARCSPGRMKG